MQSPTPEPLEETVWQGSPSQWLNFSTYLVSAIVVALLVAGAVYLQVSRPGVLPGFLVDNKGTALLGLVGLMLVPAFFVLRAYVVTRSIHYQISTERIMLTTGVFSRSTDNLELYRVDDIEVHQPFFLRLIGRGNLIARTSDRTTPQLVLTGLPDPHALRDHVRKHVEDYRDRKRTRVLDMSGGDTVI